MNETTEALAVTLFGELFMADQLARNVLSRALPKGMELSHFSVLNHLAHIQEERSPAQLAQAFHVTRGAMTNTLSKLELAGYIHIRPDWDDARRKQVHISPSGVRARDVAIDAVLPIIQEMLDDLGVDEVRSALPILRALRRKLAEEGAPSKT
ncbi:MarR family winged helix-turn-helix transcriptional regulator [Actibacterium pelagium]|uniref:MarR family transcriptional regulator n=1 Tax=Actibacterium pelagium TaxID=2029103 RepID=A0A917AI79_9RHOB|nr:MarR family transcriptional regulator [Actibacterium pelagium]GGE55208.1 MarR family transcriptional regulator [Actibacterium pelagium]